MEATKQLFRPATTLEEMRRAKMRRSCFGGDGLATMIGLLATRSRIFGISWICGCFVLEDTSRIVALVVQEMAMGKRASTG